MKKKQKQLHVCITGGHVTPALAVIEYIKSACLPWRLSYIGRTVAFEGSSVVSPEKRLIKNAGVSFYTISTGRFQRSFHITETVGSLIKVPVGFFQSVILLLRLKPDIILSFGGYIALPVSVAAFFLRIPVVTHEQTMVSGLANKIIGMFAKKILVSFKPMDQSGGNRVVCTGLPIRKSIFSPPSKPSFFLPGTIPLIYITGGSTGAASMNTLLFPIIPDLVARAVIVHQTGETTYEEANKVKDLLPENLKTRYVVFPYIKETDVSYLLHHATVVVSRAGANTIAEIATTGTPSVLVPLPWSGGGEQKKNAEYINTIVPVRIVDQTKATPASLKKAILDMMNERIKTEKKTAPLFPADAEKRIVDELAGITSYA